MADGAVVIRGLAALANDGEPATVGRVGGGYVMKRVGLIVLAFFALGGSATTVAWAQSGQPRSFPSPSWTEPRQRGVSRLMRGSSFPGRRASPELYPRESFDPTVNGEVVVVCRRAGVKLEACRAERETPEGMGFGRVAVQQVEAQWQNSPGRVSGTVTGNEVRVSYTVAAPVAGQTFVTEAPWAQVPSGEAIRIAWPKALTNTVQGTAALRCRIEADGSLSNCRVAGETPWRSDLGRAALALVPAYRVEMGGPAGDLSGSDIIVSVRLTNPADTSERVR